jgi:adenosine receptor A2b
MEKMSWKKEIRAAKWFAIVLALFAFCWLPLHVMNLVTLLTGKTCIYCIIVAVMLSHANSAINPILYAYSNSKFYTAFRAMLRFEAVSIVR